jgi:hypothetical protein
MTIIILLCGIYFLARRLLSKKARIISKPADYLMLAIAITPFATGFLAFHQIGNYQIMILLHIISGCIMLIAIPFTMSHCIYFFLNRSCRIWKEKKPGNAYKIRSLLESKRHKIQAALRSCAHCTICADTCFKYNNIGGKDPKYMPSRKFLDTVGLLFKKKGDVTMEKLEEMRDILWDRCALCMRCECPMGIDIPEILALGRQICRSQDIYPAYDGTGGES